MDNKASINAKNHHGAHRGHRGRHREFLYEISFWPSLRAAGEATQKAEKFWIASSALPPRNDEGEV